jgi:hypothetical protein
MKTSDQGLGPTLNHDAPNLPLTLGITEERGADIVLTASSALKSPTAKTIPEAWEQAIERCRPANANEHFFLVYCLGQITGLERGKQFAQNPLAALLAAAQQR